MLLPDDLVAAVGAHVVERVHGVVQIYHGWRYGLDGKVNHITNEDEFFDLDKSTLQMPPVHCEVWAGFIFVHAHQAGESS